MIDVLFTDIQLPISYEACVSEPQRSTKACTSLLLVLAVSARTGTAPQKPSTHKSKLWETWLQCTAILEEDATRDESV